MSLSNLLCELPLLAGLVLFLWAAVDMWRAMKNRKI